MSFLLQLETALTTGHSFCEEDYVITRYVAEFVNAFTNLAYGMSAIAILIVDVANRC